VPAKLPPLAAGRLGELTGHTLAHYEVGPVLDTGPLSVIFRAQDLKQKKTVALRVLSPVFPAKETEMEAFVKTVRVVMPLRHPNLVGLWNAGRTGPYCWMAGDYVEGENLTAVLQQLNPPGKFAWKHALRLGVHLARVLNYLHCRHLSHGNIMPANILIRGTDKAARLGGLLLGQALKGSALEQATHEQRLQAELPYQSPEKTAGLSNVDILSDVYSLGATMYARCAGRPPFVGKSLEETIQQIHEAPLVPLRQHQPAVPQAFEAVVLKMLARRREDRFRTPAEVLAELESLAESEGVEL
jgi:serine/threonine protein kinase